MPSLAPGWSAIFCCLQSACFLSFLESLCCPNVPFLTCNPTMTHFWTFVCRQPCSTLAFTTWWAPIGIVRDLVYFAQLIVCSSHHAYFNTPGMLKLILVLALAPGGHCTKSVHSNYSGIQFTASYIILNASECQLKNMQDLVPVTKDGVVKNVSRRFSLSLTPLFLLVLWNLLFLTTPQSVSLIPTPQHLHLLRSCTQAIVTSCWIQTPFGPTPLWCSSLCTGEYTSYLNQGCSQDFNKGALDIKIVHEVREKFLMQATPTN